MARKAMKVKQQKLREQILEPLKEGKEPKKSRTKYYNRCRVCGREGGYMREFGVCRICFRNYARKGMIAGVRKASW